MLRTLLRLAPTLTRPTYAPQATRIITDLKFETSGPPPPPSDPNEWWKRLSRNVPQGIPQDQYSGRSLKMHLGPRNRQSSPFRRLSGILSRTGVRKEIRLGEFYEKRSDKRIRLESERHRRRFQEMVRSRVQMVQLIKNRK